MDGTRLIQIYWDDRQLGNLFTFSVPYKNETLTPFFENSVIAELAPKQSADRFGIASPQLRQKIGGGIPLREPFTEEVINRPYEILSLTRRSPEMRMIWRMNEWHKGSGEILYRIFDKLGLPRPSEPKNPIFQNHFIAKREIYQEYVGKFLIPAMNLMENDEEIHSLVNVDSGYWSLKPPNSDWRKRVEKFIGPFVPLHTFILERCFSCWINDKPIKVSYL